MTTRWYFGWNIVAAGALPALAAPPSPTFQSISPTSGPQGGGTAVTIADLPGLYSIESVVDPATDEGVARRFLDRTDEGGRPRLVVQVLDATQLALEPLTPAESRRIVAFVLGGRAIPEPLVASRRLCLGVDERLDVPDEKSRASARATVRPRVAASRAIPAPVMPPPMTRRSNVVEPMRASASAREPRRAAARAAI